MSALYCLFQFLVRREMGNIGLTETILANIGKHAANICDVPKESLRILGNVMRIFANSRKNPREY